MCDKSYFTKLQKFTEFQKLAEWDAYKIFKMKTTKI